MNEVDVSLIVPAFNEGENIRPFYQAVIDAFSSFDGSFEIVFVDDGSTDNTYEEIAAVAQTSECPVTAVSFSRNFGKEAAMYAGLEHARGKAMGFIDADLQQRPSTFLEMYELLEANPEFDCIAAYQEHRSGGMLRDFFSRSFYGILAKSSRMEVIRDASDFRVFRSYVGEALLRMGERNRFSKGLFSWIGFKTMSFAYTPDSRNAGETSWSFLKLTRYAIDGLFAFTTFPLKISTVLGVISSIAAIIYLAVVVIQRIVWGIDVPGYATIVVLLLLFGGLQMLVLGMLGSYMARDYIEGKRRPIYIARRVIHAGNDTAQKPMEVQSNAQPE